ncbi:hypothetical protein CRE_20603 [Caenorhabditis remanei]|uniref:Uncharacterized protein n=1 Tax=Caenorhabditis remanei TaxID=31234 RepID=E3NKU8_CAERE|nr:hypothetical protein CRE_20603 [Caenorhabditis remanei]
MEWEKSVLQKTIGKLTSELEEQTGKRKHLLEGIQGEEDMIKTLKIVINETETRTAIDVAQLLKTANEKK